MYRRILVPVDGSPFAEAAIPLALSVARRSAAEVELITVELPIPAMVLSESGIGMPAPDLGAAEPSNAEYLERLRDRIAMARTGVHVDTTVLRGAVAEALETHAEQARCDLVVLATHGRGPLQRWWLGSVATSMIRTCKVPVLLARPNAEPVDLALDFPFHRILIPLDGTPEAEAIIPYALSIGTPMESEVTLVRVVYPPYTATSVYAPLSVHLDERALSDRVADAERQLETVAEHIRAAGYQCEALAISGGDAADEIASLAKLQSTDLIAMATHGRRGLPRWILGSVAEYVIRAARVPVLVLRTPLA